MSIFKAKMNLHQMTILIVQLFLLSYGVASSSTSIKPLRRQTRELSNRCVCGIENTNTKLQRIIAGTEIKPELRFPWLVPLAYRNGSFFCGGTLINSRYILTSAHCFKYSKQDAAGELRYMISSDAVIVPERYTANILVGLGVHNLISDDQSAPTKDKIQPMWLTIDYAVVHRFYENFETAIRHDIALIRLRKEIDFDRIKWLRPICLPDEDQFELERFNKFQLEQYVQPNIADLNSPTPSPNNNQLNSQTTSQASNQAANQLKDQLNKLKSSNSINSQMNSKMTNAMNNQMKNQMDIKMNNKIINQMHNQVSNYSSIMLGGDAFDGNRSNVFSSMFNINDNVDLHSYLIMNNETMKSIDRINSKRLILDKNLEDIVLLNPNNRTRRDLASDENQYDELFFSAGWGSTERVLNNEWKLSKVPLWIQLKMLTREQCIEKNGERVKWNFICAQGVDKEQETAVGDSGGPLFGQIRRKNQNIKNRFAMNRPMTIRTSTLSTPRPTNTSQQSAYWSTTEKTTTTLSATTTTTEQSVIKYISKAPPPYKLLSKRPQRPVSHEMNNLLTKVKANTNRHFYSAMIYEDLFKTLNLPHDDSIKFLKDEIKETKDVVDGEDLEVESENYDSIRSIATTKPIDRFNSTSSLNHELDLSRKNYVQLGITSWSSYLNPEIGMFTDVRAYIGWIKRNTQDAHYCITNPSKMTDDSIPIPTEKPDSPDLMSNLNCGAERLDKVSYPWLNSLYMDEKFLGNCVYFYSNFVICSDIYAEQITQDINTLVHRISVQFYYPNYRFRARNIVNKLLGSATVSRREYLIVQLEDPDKRLQRDATSRKLNRALIEAQINKNNAQASCVSTRDYPMNEESSNLVTFYLFAPGENLIKTQLKLVPRRKCRQLAPNFVTSRFLCAQIGSSEEINISEQMVSSLRPMFSAPSRLEASNNASSLTMKLKNFFRLQSNRFNGHYSNMNSILKSEDQPESDLTTSLNKNNRELLDRSGDLKEVLDGQPVFHKIDEQYTLVGFLVKTPFPLTSAFKHNNLILLLDLKKFRFQIVTKLMKSLRAYNRA